MSHFSLLALETSTERCSAALFYKNQCLYEDSATSLKNSQLILPMLEKLLAQAGLKFNQVDAIAFGCGPGSFTGVRLATGVAQSLAFAWNIPLIPISTLHALAQKAWHKTQKTPILSALDARLQQVYWGYYELKQGHFIEACPFETVSDPNTIQIPTVNPDSLKEIIGIGHGWDQFNEPLKYSLKKIGFDLISWLPQCSPHAQEVAWLATHYYQSGQVIDPLAVTPNYLRNQIAQTIYAQKSTPLNDKRIL